MDGATADRQLHTFGPFIFEHKSPTNNLIESTRLSARHIYAIPNGQFKSLSLTGDCPCCLRNVLTDPKYENTKPNEEFPADVMRYLVGCSKYENCIHTRTQQRPKRVRCFLCAINCRQAQVHTCFLSPTLVSNKKAKSGYCHLKPSEVLQTEDRFANRYDPTPTGGHEVRATDAKDLTRIDSTIDDYYNLCQDLFNRTESLGSDSAEEGYEIPSSNASCASEGTVSSYNEDKAGAFYEVWEPDHEPPMWNNFRKDHPVLGEKGSMFSHLPAHYKRDYDPRRKKEEKFEPPAEPGADRK